MTFGKRQLVIAAMVVALGSAVYLNWQFSGTTPVDVTSTDESTTKQLGQTTYVNTEISGKNTSSQPENNVKAVNSDEKSVDTGHFAAMRAKRDEANSKAVEALEDIVESASSDEAAKKDAVAAAEKLAKAIKAQADIENEIKLKGFEDAYVSVNNENCSVYVYKGTLDDAAAVVIKDIVSRQLGTSYGKIAIAQSE